MNARILGTLAVILLLFGGLIFAAVHFGGGVAGVGDSQSAEASDGSVGGEGDSSASAGASASSSEGGSDSSFADSETQGTLKQISAKMLSELEAESRLNLNLLAQLRSYQELLRQIEGYAQKVEQDLSLIEEISKDEFQEDVQLQASLFTGKKPALVAKHLEEFRASRVGAILSKMKEKEASAVLDVWAKEQDPKVSTFYREVTASYLSNKRRELHPDLFDKVNSSDEVQTADMN